MFRAKTGDTSFFTFALNPDWVRSMNVAATESSGIGGGPPSEQWSHRPAFFFAWENQVLWGMGLPLGIAVWIFLFTGWVQIFRSGETDLWKKLLLPLLTGQASAARMPRFTVSAAGRRPVCRRFSSHAGIVSAAGCRPLFRIPAFTGRGFSSVCISSGSGALSAPVLVIFSTHTFLLQVLP